MNLYRIRRLAEKIHSVPKVPREARGGFNMADFAHSCGTPSCIGGWTIALFAPHLSIRFNSFDDAKEILDLTERQAQELFFCEDVFQSGCAENFQLEQITPDQAADVLLHLADTGEVRWDLFLPKGLGQ